MPLNTDVHERSSPPGRWIRWGFAFVSVVDAVVVAALALSSQVGPGPKMLATQLAYSTGHILFCGLVLGVFADVGDRLLPRRALVRGIAAWLTSIAVGFAIFSEDYANFEPTIRVLLVVASGLPYGVLVAMSPLVRRSRAAAGSLMVASLGLTVVNSFVLVGGYAGIHLAMTLAAGLLASVSLASWLDHRIATEGLAVKVGWGVTAAMVVASVAISPSNAVQLKLVRQPSASVVTFLARLRHVESSTASSAAQVVPTEQEQWFVDRSDRAPIAPTRPALHDKPIVLFITVDALRADLFTNPSEAATTNLRAMGAEGTLFTHARSPASATSPSIGALFTGKYYSSLYWTRHKVGRKRKYFLPKDPTPRWPALLEDQGVRRKMVRRRGGFGPESGLVGGMNEYTTPYKWADEIVDAIIRFLDSRGDEPLLIYAHMMDPHAPYTSRGKFDEPRDGYLAEVAFVDEHIGRLWSYVREHGLDERTFFVVSSDHGEAFGEHGTKYHAANIYEELVRIPLIVVGPNVVPRVLNEPVSLIDLGPTILDLFGAPTPGYFMGQSLVPLLSGGNTPLSRPIILDTGRRKQAIIGRDGLKTIRNLRDHTTELYDLNADPQELQNLIERRPAVAKKRLGALAAFFEAHEIRRKGYKVPYRK